MIKIEDVHFSYQPQAGGIVPALSGVNLEIKPGEFVVVVGHNGSGKSTLAKHLNVLNKPTSGDVWINGMNTKVEANLWPVRKYVGMVFQNPDNQIVSTVVEDDIAFGPENLGVDPLKIQKYVDESLKIMHLEDIRDSAPHMLSGGQKQRVAIAGVLAMRCQTIVLDEPTALLDPDSRREVLESLHRINREEKLTVILITHYMEEAIGADRIVVMDGGKAVLMGTPREVFAQVDKIRALSLDVPMATQIAAELYARGYDISPNCLSEEEVVDAICRLL